MKHLLLIRHADSAYDFFTSDFDRNLTDEGTAQCRLLDTFIHENQLKLQLILSSAARRAMETAKAISSPVLPIHSVEELYNAPASQIIETIQQTNNEFDTIALVGHNPGVTDLLNYHSNVRIDNLPTGSAVFLNTNITHWGDFSKEQLSYLYFHKP